MKKYIKSSNYIQSGSLLPGVSDNLVLDMMDDADILNYQNAIKEFEDLGWYCKITRGSFSRGGGMTKYFPKIQLSVPQEDWSDNYSRTNTRETIKRICKKYDLLTPAGRAPDRWKKKGYPDFIYRADKIGQNPDGTIKLTVK